MDPFVPEPPENTESPAAPFAVELARADERPDGSFRPAARLYLTPDFQSSGLLSSLAAEDLRSLLAVLALLHPNGWIRPGLLEIAGVLGVSGVRARTRMARLLAARLSGNPLLVTAPRESGLDAYTPAPGLVTTMAAPTAPPADEPEPLHTAGPEAVIAWSRAHYSRPREEVERDIARRMGWDAPEAAETPEEAERLALRRRLRASGVLPEQVDELMASYPLERIERQLDWLPYRQARRPGPFLVAAITGDYEPPKGLPPLTQPLTIEDEDH